jgi:hypothetical protein
MEKPNRADRRKNKFGGGRATDHGGWPTVQPNPVFQVETPAPPTDEPAVAKPDGADEPAPNQKGSDVGQTAD